ncbi:Biotin carboxyl carrier protein of acetyl-CoA carboxylase [Bathymodiolus thermophilus thioautotrophic gill symbiont]|jgi:acetyl-CoA carboxylase biotin carboxyl carrier protein|uniref:Biotin carboxyl carrier protein of acetyl-CoA carboxylase n=1 Tax=Bathymodiolus thermophilus thioautotrophic gill symbiont TaxID=2360 RepID=A0A1J5TUR8_9GAMM|nr:acetyl-CoA carboxylase biotin carboxyl carrier protein [Bathymodiolus thermophilus thioautotrophic gill symbiont]AYQ55864.1 Biotin carboxyl carrier protein [Bathymodiolus thermophilus thioautotrophic gill symbiont]OIR24546.1 acetyl-CoA carboxylase, biotin carboxyl carrier protein [Bathymodiolus thermophilus thioautotrophic gill symbiont]CAB5497017.1 Biotin carboxyl carrier protein of acetyl-CoA carboxylase [Bathymodiolus thermophilus thioautotrophic gill symbiont]CAB5500049.1 Biotin carboxyl
MDIRKVKKLMELLEESGMAEIEIVEGKESVRISRYGNAPVAAAPIQVAAPVAVAPVANVETTEATVIDGHPITSPMVGTFYGAASPTSEAFVKVGQHINQGDTICIVEAMKIMNKIEATQSGTVTEILCNDGDGVEFGQTLIIIK